MEKQPPKAGKDRKDDADKKAQDEHFVLEPQPEKRRRRWLSTDPETGTTQAYEPRQFNLENLPDDKQPPTSPDTTAEADMDLSLPLGYVSEPRPAKVKPAQRPADTQPEPAAERNETPPLGFVSEPRPVQADAVDDTRLGFIDASEGPVTDAGKPEAPGAPAVKPSAPEGESDEDATQTPGHMLRRARMDKGLSPEDIALETKMPLETVLALEEDRDPEQSAWVYVRGFYRRYARALGIPVEPLLDAHANLAGEKARATAEPVASEWVPQDVSPAPSPVPKMILVVITSVVLGVTAWWFGPQVGLYVKELNLGDKASTAYNGIKTVAVEAKNQGAEFMDSASETVKTQSAVIADKAGEQYNKAAEKVKTEATPLIEAARAQRDAVRKQAAAKSAGNAGSNEKQDNTPVAAQTESEVQETAVSETIAEPAPAAAEPEPAMEVAQAQSEPESQEPEAEAPASAEPQAQPESEVAPAESMLEPETAGPLDMAANEPASASEQATEQPQANTPAAAVAVLELEFSRQSWLSVSEGTGLVLFEDMVEGGSSKRLEGEPPITLFLGTATAATARFNDQPVNIASQMRSNGTARILLGANE